MPPRHRPPACPARAAARNPRMRRAPGAWRRAARASTFAQARSEDDAGRLRVDPDVELGGGRRVPAGVGAAHDDRRGDALDDPRLQLDRHRDVGQRADRHEGDRLRGGHVGLDQEFCGSLRLLDRAWRGDRQLESVHAARPVQDRARDREIVAHQRARRSFVDRDRRARAGRRRAACCRCSWRPGCCRSRWSPRPARDRDAARPA